MKKLIIRTGLATLVLLFTHADDADARGGRGGGGGGEAWVVEVQVEAWVEGLE